MTWSSLKLNFRKEPLKKMKRGATDWEKIFAYHVSKEWYLD
jgi:hypothetical protein